MVIVTGVAAVAAGADEKPAPKAKPAIAMLAANFLIFTCLLLKDRKCVKPISQVYSKLRKRFQRNLD
jgi:hypothetical protein